MTGLPYQMVSLVEFLSDSLNVFLLEFDKLLRLVQRQSNAAEPLPPFFVKTLLSLEDSLNAALMKEKEAKKKMNATNARALNSMKQKVRKTAKEFEKEVQQYQNVSFLYHSITILTSRRIQKHSNVNLPLTLNLPMLLPPNPKSRRRAQTLRVTGNRY